MQRSVFSSSRVKSMVKKPVTCFPSKLIVRLREANSGCASTSVVSSMFGSWRAISTPSLVETRSGSMKSAPSAMALA